MNERTFLKQFEQSVDSDRLVELVYDEMVSFCRGEEITEDDISTPKLERLAEGVVERGLGVPESDETAIAKGKYRSDEFEQDMETIIEELKRLSNEDADYNFEVTEDA